MQNFDGRIANPGRRSLRELALGCPARHLRCDLGALPAGPAKPVVRVRVVFNRPFPPEEKEEASLALGLRPPGARNGEEDEDELLLLVEKVPDQIRRRVVQRPDAYRKLARLDDKALDRLVAQIEE